MVVPVVLATWKAETEGTLSLCIQGQPKWTADLIFKERNLDVMVHIYNIALEKLKQKDPQEFNTSKVYVKLARRKVKTHFNPIN